MHVRTLLRLPHGIYSLHKVASSISIDINKYLPPHTPNTLSSTRSILAPSSTASESDSYVSAVASMDSNGKAPLASNGTKFAAGTPGADKRLINVQPPRREDLQPAYAQTLQGESEDAGSHGWYGSMSMFATPLHPFSYIPP